LSTIDSVVKKYRSTGTVENRPRKGRRKLFTARDEVGLNRSCEKKLSGTFAGNNHQI
jgi:transposase